MTRPARPVPAGLRLTIPNKNRGNQSINWGSIWKYCSNMRIMLLINNNNYYYIHSTNISVKIEGLLLPTIH